MANALSAAGEPAPVPEIAQQNNALRAQTPGPAQQQAAPQLTHQQTVASLRHFSAIARELEVFLKDPDLGKADLKSKIIDGTTKLVANRIITPAQAVMQLGTVPSDPLLQRKWVQQHFQQTIMSQNAVLDHHAQANPGSGDLPNEIAASTSKPDLHLDDMMSVHAGYRGGAR